MAQSNSHAQTKAEQSALQTTKICFFSSSDSDDEVTKPIKPENIEIPIAIEIHVIIPNEPGTIAEIETIIEIALDVENDVEDVPNDYAEGEQQILRENIEVQVVNEELIEFQGDLMNKIRIKMKFNKFGVLLRQKPHMSILLLNLISQQMHMFK
ncbi:hypothetical protein L6452_06471 [Arctium lappa]|uniref:Uncharacterized protein n=1 Tax=Arctium lappa TaxID=4217 RepID=A0ACB9EJY4_ARCLA|nr:hypothetical protein L6452_06471 [Arctium lappa]